MEYNEELALASEYVYTLAHYNDRFYIFDCPCDKEIAGRNKTELLENFGNHFKECSAR